MLAEFIEDIFACTVQHTFWYVVSNSVWIESISPKDLNIFGLAIKVRLECNNNAHHPVWVFECHQSPGAWDISLKCSEHVEKLFVLHRHCEWLPDSFVHICVKRFRVSELSWVAISDLLPKSEARSFFWCGKLCSRFPRTYWGTISHTSVLDEAQIILKNLKRLLLFILDIYQLLSNKFPFLFYNFDINCLAPKHGLNTTLF